MRQLTVGQRCKRRATMNSGPASAPIVCSRSIPASRKLMLRPRLTALSLIAGLAIFAWIPTTLSDAQTAATGAITGVVSDPTGAVVENAKVTVTSEAIG